MCYKLFARLALVGDCGTRFIAPIGFVLGFPFAFSGRFPLAFQLDFSPYLLLILPQLFAVASLCLVLSHLFFFIYLSLLLFTSLSGCASTSFFSLFCPLRCCCRPSSSSRHLTIGRRGFVDNRVVCALFQGGAARACVTLPLIRGQKRCSVPHSSVLLVAVVSFFFPLSFTFSFPFPP